MVAMIGYSKLGAKIWKLIDYFEPAVTRELKARDFEELDNEIMAWYMSVPEAIRTDSLEGGLIPMPRPADPSYELQRLRLWTLLRLNQVRPNGITNPSLCGRPNLPFLGSHMAVHAHTTQRHQYS